MEMLKMKIGVGPYSDGSGYECEVSLSDYCGAPAVDIEVHGTAITLQERHIDDVIRAIRRIRRNYRPAPPTSGAE